MRYFCSFNIINTILSFLDQEVPCFNSRNGGLRLSAYYVGPRRKIKSHAVFGHLRRMYETVGYGSAGSLGVQEPSFAVTTYQRRQYEIFFYQKTSGNSKCC